MSSGQAADVVVRLDLRGDRGVAAGLDHVRVERSLHEVANLRRAGSTPASKTRMNSSPTAFRFSSGSATPSSRARKRSSRVDVDERHVEVPLEGLDDLRRLVLAQQAVVDEDADELVADRLVHEQRRDRRVHAARERAEHALVADLRPDPLHLLLDHGRGRPGRRRRRRRRRGSSSAAPARGACARPRGGTARRRAAAPDPRRPRSARPASRAVTRAPAGGAVDRVAVAHPADLLGRQAGEELALAAARRALPSCRTRRRPCARPCRRAPAPSAACRSRCRASARPARRARDRPAARPRRTPTPGRPRARAPAGCAPAPRRAEIACGTSSE